MDGQLDMIMLLLLSNVLTGYSGSKTDFARDYPIKYRVIVKDKRNKVLAQSTLLNSYRLNESYSGILLVC